MTVKRWTLTSDHPAAYIDRLEAPAGTYRGAAESVAIQKWRAQGGLSQGVDLIEIHNGKLSFIVSPTRGMSLWEARVGELRFGWRSPVRGPVHPMFVDLGEPSGLGWLDGFDELLARCGLESNGAPEFDEQGQLRYPLHGRIGNKPAHQVEVELDEQTGQVSVTGVVEECRFHFLKLRMSSTISTMPHSDTLTIVDRIENLSASPAEFQMLYHCNFGEPLLDAGSTVVAPATDIVPRNERAKEGLSQWSHYAAEQPGFEEQVYLAKLAGDAEGQTHVLLKNAHATQGACLSFDVKSLPCFTIWKNTTSRSDGFVTGLEPGTNYPNPRTFEGQQGRFARLGPGESTTLGLRLQCCTTADSIAQAEHAIRAIRDQPPVVHVQPPQGWIP